jgi:TetR/AcrR family acrAB operon transcriptional repressor
MYFKLRGIMARKCKDDAEKTRQAILESALDVFSEKGFAKATFDEIAAHAGFTKGAVYWYFRNKADLLSALIVEYLQRKRAEILPSLPSGNTLDDLLQYFVVWAGVGKEDIRFAKFHRFMLCQMEWSEAIIDRVDKNLNIIKDFHLEKINKVLLESRESGVLKDELDLDEIQHVILASYIGIMFSTLSKRHDFDMVEIVKVGLGVLFDGIKK